MFNRLQKSFSTRLSAAIIGFTIVVFVAAFSVFYIFSSRTIERDARKKAEDTFEITNQKIENVLRKVEISLNSLEWIISSNKLSADSLYLITRRVVSENPDIYGSAIAFEPFHFKDKGEYFSPYSYIDSNQVRSIQLDAEYDYFRWGWYTQPKELGEPCWIGPYFDEGGGNAIICTYSIPLYDKAGKFIGIFTADISLDWLADLINDLKKSDQSYAYMLNNEGTYIAHYLKERILRRNIFEVSDEMKSSGVEELGRRMVSGERGTQMVNNDGVMTYVFFGTLTHSQWSLAIVTPTSDVFGELYRINRIVLVIIIVGLLLLFIFSWRIVRRLTQPLHDFAASARQIAQGNFNAHLPGIKSKDEMKELADSFQYMQNELTNYIANLRDTTAAKEKIDSELRIAREIQMGMIPKIFPPFPTRREIDLYAVLKPAKEVGGDLYDFFMDGENLFFVIGDVSGKGVPASLFMAVTRSLFRSAAGHLQSPAAIVSSLNTSISENNDANMFITLFVAVLNVETGKMKFCNAGHNPPLLLNPNGHCEFMKTEANVPVGVVSNYAFKEQQMLLASGTLLLCYTDGVTEAENTAEQLYSEKRLFNIVSNCKGCSSRKLINDILQDINLHVNNNEPSDDITMMAVDYNKHRLSSNVEHETLTINNDIIEIQRLAEFVERICEQLDLSPALTMNLNLALEEAVSNVILYAYPNDEKGRTIDITIGKTGDELKVVITDSGTPFDPTAQADPDITLPAEERSIGGLGIFMVKKIMDTVAYQRIDEKNILTLKKIIKNV